MFFSIATTMGAAQSIIAIAAIAVIDTFASAVFTKTKSAAVSTPDPYDALLGDSIFSYLAEIGVEEYQHPRATQQLCSRSRGSSLTSVASTSSNSTVSAVSAISNISDTSSSSSTTSNSLTSLETPPTPTTPNQKAVVITDLAPSIPDTDEPFDLEENLAYWRGFFQKNDEKLAAQRKAQALKDLVEGKAYEHHPTEVDEAASIVDYLNADDEDVIRIPLAPKKVENKAIVRLLQDTMKEEKNNEIMPPGQKATTAVVEQESGLTAKSNNGRVGGKKDIRSIHAAPRYAKRKGIMATMAAIPEEKNDLAEVTAWARSKHAHNIATKKAMGPVRPQWTLKVSVRGGSPTPLNIECTMALGDYLNGADDGDVYF